jgi:site-specific DNA-methyltransferase (adenine-specific)
MSLYYEDEYVQLHHGDALEVLADLPSGSVHHTVTDPPYILQAGSSSKAGSKTGGWADMMNASHWFSAWYREAGRITQGTGSMWTFGNWRSLPVMMRAAIDAGIPTTSLMVWDKDWIGPAGPQALRSQHEICLVMANPAFKLPNRSQGDVLRVKASSDKPTGHPAEKPVALLRRVIELTGIQAGQTILDPFTGSGTAMIASRELGVKTVAIEAEERWCEVAVNRLQQQAFVFSAIE